MTVVSLLALLLGSSSPFLFILSFVLPSRCCFVEERLHRVETAPKARAYYNSERIYSDGVVVVVDGGWLLASSFLAANVGNVERWVPPVLEL